MTHIVSPPPPSIPDATPTPNGGDRETRASRSRARVVILLLGAGVAYALAPYIPGLMGAAVLYVLCVPLYTRLTRRIAERWSAIVIVVGMALVLVIPGAWLLGALVGQAQDAARRLNDSGIVGRLDQLTLGGVNVGAQLARMGESAVAWVSGQALSLFGSATRSVLNLVIALFGLYYLLLLADTLWADTRRYLPFSQATTEALRARFHTVTEAMTLGTALTAVLQGTIVGVGFVLVGLPNALFWGCITACASILPVLGSGIVWLPAAAILVARGELGRAILLAAIGAVVASNIDNVIRPLIYKRVSNIHPMITLVGAFAGVSLFGLVGLLLGPLAISYFFALVKAYEEEFGAPVSSDRV